MPRLAGSNHDHVMIYILSVSKKHESKIAAIMADLPSKVDPVEYPATYNWKAFDVRLTMRYNESHFSEIFDHQRQFYSSRVQMSIEGVEVDLLTEILEC